MTPNRDGTVTLFPIAAIEPATLSADPTAIAVDVRGYQSATIMLSIGVGGITFTGTNKIEFVLTHSDDGTTYTAVTDDDLVKDMLTPATVTNGVVRALTAAHAAATLQKIGYVGGRAYLKLLPDFSGTHGTGTPISATVIRSRAALRGAA